MRRHPLRLAFVSIFVAVIAAATPAQQVGEDGFTRLFADGTLSGWRTIALGTPQGTWSVRDGIVSYEPGESWLASEAIYTDFELRLEYRAGADSDSGIFMRSTPVGYPSFTGMELEIKGGDVGTAPTARSTSSVYGAVAPRRVMNREAGQWNQVEVSVVGRRLRATWNGDVVHDINLDDPAYATALRGPLSQRVTEGHIGFQAHATGAPVEFRNLRIKNLK